MLETKIAVLKCRGGSQFHFGEIAHDVNMALDRSSEYMHSDTLFSALVNEYERVWKNDQNNTTNFIEEIDKENICFSSAFYCIEKEGKYIWFVPRPAHATLLVDADFKKYRSIRFVSLDVLLKKHLPDDWFDTSKCVSIQNNSFICTLDEILILLPSIEPDDLENLNDMDLFSMQDETKVKVHTLELENRLYNQSNLMIEDNTWGLNTHFWFAYRLADGESWYGKRFLQLVKMIKYNGIGGQRSTGCGAIQDVYTNIEMNYSLDVSGYEYLLSLLHPTDKKELNNCLLYNSKIRGGRVIRQFDVDENNEKKQVTITLKRVRMITEGAIVHSSVIGTIKDITPLNNGYVELGQRMYLRHGKKFSIPIPKVFVPDEFILQKQTNENIENNTEVPENNITINGKQMEVEIPIKPKYQTKKKNDKGKKEVKDEVVIETKKTDTNIPESKELAKEQEEIAKSTKENKGFSSKITYKLKHLFGK